MKIRARILHFASFVKMESEQREGRVVPVQVSQMARRAYGIWRVKDALQSHSAAVGPLLTALFGVDEVAVRWTLTAT